MTLVNPLMLSLAVFASSQEQARLSDQFHCSLAPPIRALLESEQTNLTDSRLILELIPNHRGFGGGEVERRVILKSTPIASWSLEDEAVQLDLATGSLTAGTPELSHPSRWESLEGAFLLRPRLQIDRGPTEPPQMVSGPEIELVLAAEREEVLTLELDEILTGPLNEDLPHPGIMEIEIGSPLLEGPVKRRLGAVERTHRAHVVVPMDYHSLNATRRRWPVVYVIPGESSPEETAEVLSRLANEPSMRKILPQVIWVVLDPRTPYGHHYFLDSRLHGLRSRALVEEFVPWIDVRFRTIPQADARILVGEQQGGSSVLHLLAEHGDVFSNAWSTSPEAVCFASLGHINLYEDPNCFEQLDGRPKPALRSPLGTDRILVHLDVQGEVMRSRAADPTKQGRERWHELCAVFGGGFGDSLDDWWPFDPVTGVTRPVQVSRWSGNDLARKVQRSPEMARRLREGARILIGARDEYYRNRGTRSLFDAVERSLETEGTSEDTEAWIDEIDSASSLEVAMIANMRRNEEIIELLKERGHHD